MKVDPAAKFVGPVWIGAGRGADPQTTLIGPFVLWDEPSARPQPPNALPNSEAPHNP